jgi:hypothetical protein
VSLDVEKERAVEELYEVVRSAINAGMTAKEFKRYAAAAWDDALVEKRRWDAAEFERP